MLPERVKTGIVGLDIVLDGGFLRGATVLVQGLPGAGKPLWDSSSFTTAQRNVGNQA